MSDEQSIEEINKKIHRILSYGIKLPKMRKTEADDYLLSLLDYINKGNVFKAVWNEKGVVIETVYMEPILMLRIRNNTLEFMPVSETGFFDSFMSVMEFFSYKKKEKELLDEFKIFIDEVDKESLEDKDTEEIEINSADDNTEEDFDWI